jgi:hypothetical protein
MYVYIYIYIYIINECLIYAQPDDFIQDTKRNCAPGWLYLQEHTTNLFLQNLSYDIYSKITFASAYWCHFLHLFATSSDCHHYTNLFTSQALMDLFRHRLITSSNISNTCSSIQSVIQHYFWYPVFVHSFYMS